MIEESIRADLEESDPCPTIIVSSRCNTNNKDEEETYPIAPVSIGGKRRWLRMHAERRQESISSLHSRRALVSGVHRVVVVREEEKREDRGRRSGRFIL